MREGIYRVDYQGAVGLGFALMMLESGIVTGSDVTGGSYDGTYAWNERTKKLDADVQVTVPAGSVLVMGNVAPPGGLTFGVRCSFPRNPDNGQVQADTDFGPIVVRMQLLRTFS